MVITYANEGGTLKARNLKGNFCFHTRAFQPELYKCYGVWVGQVECVLRDTALFKITISAKLSWIRPRFGIIAVFSLPNCHCRTYLHKIQTVFDFISIKIRLNSLINSKKWTTICHILVQSKIETDIKQKYLTNFDSCCMKLTFRNKNKMFNILEMMGKRNSVHIQNY